jgi:predicted DNA-binding protein
MKTELIGIRIAPEMRERLQKIADEETRSLSNLVLKILKDFLANYEKSTK